MSNSQESFIARHVEKQLRMMGYSMTQIETGIEAATETYRKGGTHAGGKLFAACLDAAKAKVGKPSRKGNKVQK